MEIRRILYVALSFLAINIGVGSYIVAASTFELTQTSQEISGKDSESGVTFHASRPTADHVIIDVKFGTKRVHADIDYARHALRVVSVSQANNATILLSAEDIVAFQKLLVSLPPKINTYSLHGDALASLVNLIASAPAGNALRGSNMFGSWTSICPQIHRQGVAVYTLLSGGLQRKKVTVGPVCYKPPALGRCGEGGGPDPGYGYVQRFTQECLNHDQCCAATKDRFIKIHGILTNVCGNSGNECMPELDAATPSFFFAPDCGTTAGHWTDTFGFTYVLSGGDGVFAAQEFMGQVKTAHCGAYHVKGTRTGKMIVFTATKPPPTESCAGSYTYTGTYDDCNTAEGEWINSIKKRGKWSWKRTNTVSQPVLLSGANAGPRPTDK